MTDQELAQLVIKIAGKVFDNRSKALKDELLSEADVEDMLSDVISENKELSVTVTSLTEQLLKIDSSFKESSSSVVEQKLQIDGLQKQVTYFESLDISKQLNAITATFDDVNKAQAGTDAVLISLGSVDEELSKMIKDAADVGQVDALKIIENFSQVDKHTSLISDSVTELTNKLDDVGNAVEIQGKTQSEIISSNLENIKDIKDSIASGNEHALTTFSKAIDKVTEQFKNVDEKIDTVETSTLLKIKALDSTVLKITDQVSADFDTLSDEMKTGLEKALGDSIENIELKHSNKITDELLRLNSHVNDKLNHSKGEQGEQGEKGAIGESGFLSGVSSWENGNIIKARNAVSHKGGLWLTKEDTAKEPSISDAGWTLISNGVSETEIINGNLHIKFSDGSTIDHGRVMMVDKGNWAGQSNDTDGYDKMDTVTYNKSTFMSLCQNNTDKPPSDKWRMVVGKGDNGSRGIQGEHGPKGDSLLPDDLIPVIEDVIDKRAKIS